VPDGSCSVPACDRPRYCKGYCGPHYRRWSKYGDPAVGGPIRQRINGTPEQRFWPKVNKNGPVPERRPELGACWLWTADAETTNGYPQFRLGRRMVLAHRASWTFIVGPPPADLQLDHLCRVKRCVRPEHLDPVTNAVNAARRTGFHYATACSAGHAMADENVRVTASGIRVCRICSPDTRTDLDEVCPNGHPRTAEITRINNQGRRYCRICARDATRRYRQS
jgi:hypothetical protein